MSEPMLTIFLKPETVSEASHALVTYRDGVALKHNIRVSSVEDYVKVEVENSGLNKKLAVNLNLCNKENKSVYWTAI